MDPAFQKVVPTAQETERQTNGMDTFQEIVPSRLGLSASVDDLARLPGDACAK
jgi:hypothetical protein